MGIRYVPKETYIDEKRPKKRPVKETYTNKKSPTYSSKKSYKKHIKDTCKDTYTYEKSPTYSSKESYNTEALIGIKYATKETYTDETRPIKETCKRDLDISKESYILIKRVQ